MDDDLPTDLGSDLRSTKRRAIDDEQTADMFGDRAPACVARADALRSSPAYQVLARKYRPRTFEDLIGQEAMVRTLRNAFSSGRIAHAFMLTGVRGVGKTTTARLLARALNYTREGADHPSLDLAVEGLHCGAIIEGRHMDVLELDAASRTKVDEMRELLDGVRYAPSEARYKVYIIDEVHMLSTSSFNALLKTLEEPPPHAKFIFATTEIRKVPVTILSRCQRFDLRRVEPPVIVAEPGAAIAAAEGARIEPEGLTLIARAAEGSVRDAQSLLDQAIVQADAGEMVSAAAIRDMLGLADRSQTIELFFLAMKGQAGEALKAFSTLYGFGAEPVVVMLDLLDHAHGASVAKALGPDALGLPSDQAARLAQIGAAASAGTLARVWQMLLKAHDEARRAPDPKAAVEMALIRLCYAADLPGPEEALKALRDGAPVGDGRPVSGGGEFWSAGGGGSGGGPARRAWRPASGRAPRSTGAGRAAILRGRGRPDRRQARRLVEAGCRTVRAPDQLPARRHNLRARAGRAGQPRRPAGFAPEGMDRPALAGGGRGQRRRGKRVGAGKTPAAGNPTRNRGRRLRPLGDGGLPRNRDRRRAADSSPRRDRGGPARSRKRMIDAPAPV